MLYKIQKKRGIKKLFCQHQLITCRTDKKSLAKKYFIVCVHCGKVRKARKPQHKKIWWCLITDSYVYVDYRKAEVDKCQTQIV